jgi:hypothetical protein
MDIVNLTKIMQEPFSLLLLLLLLFRPCCSATMMLIKVMNLLEMTE